eukprot:TRINITY_DN82987_c0_g1_i1.p1 TRINITY_DN82987_c0_g1~~TRINITY_DN82987_c0_g1_i1.p1  ORF type:complete len:434 (-),score=120.91 TRINITY_DN82987_c0_g1_i1:103-1404(-)
MENVGACVSDLLAEHGAAITQLRDKLHGAMQELPPAEQDLLTDLLFLRHILSQQGDLERADAMLRKAMDFATDPMHAKLLAHVRAETPPAADERIQELCPAALWTEGPLSNGAPVWIIRAGFGNPQQMMDDVSAKDMLEWLLYWRLLAMQQMDRLSLQSDKLVKMMVVNDLRGAGLFASREKRFFKVLGQAGEMMEYLCPQQQMKAVLLNPPAFVSSMFRFMKPLMPAKALAKVSVCRGDTLCEPLGSCPFAKMWWPDCNVPDFLGGARKVPEGHRLFVKSAAPVDGSTELSMRPRTSQTLEVAVPESGGEVQHLVEFQLMCLPHGLALHAGVEVSAVFIAMSALTSDGTESVCGQELLPKRTIKQQDGRLKLDFRVKGPGAVGVTLRNASNARHKEVRYSLHLVPVPSAAEELAASKENGGPLALAAEEGGA